MGFQRILAAIDHSSLGQSVFEQALDLAKVNQACLMLCHCMTAEVVSSPPAFTGEFGMSFHVINQAYQSQHIYVEQQLKAVADLLRRYGEVATQTGIKTELDYRVADPGPGLCQIAQDWNADLIVVGRRGRKGLVEAILGSVSNYVLHNAPCTVMVVQPNRMAPTSTPSEATPATVHSR